MANIDHGTEDARQALDDVAQVQRAAADQQRTPGWYWHLIGAGLLVIALAQLLPPIGAVILALVAAVLLGGVIGGLQEHTGMRGDLRNPATQWIAVGAAGLFIVLYGIAAVLSWKPGWSWPWVIAGVLVYVLVVAMGRRVQARPADR